MLSNNQIHMERIVENCKALLQGSKIPSQSEQNLKNIMRQPNNFGNILYFGMNNICVLICFKKFTQQVRRNGTYFDIANNGYKRIIFMLDLISVPPPFPTQHQCNAYLCLQGQLLGALITYSNKKQVVQNYLSLQWNSPGCLQIKMHFMNKIFLSCFQQILKLKDNKSCFKIYKFQTFIDVYGQLFAIYIAGIAECIVKNYQQFNNVYNAIENLINMHESYLKVIGQYQLVQEQQKSIQVKIPQWEIRYIIEWSNKYCFYLVMILKNLKYKDDQKDEKLSTVLCKCVTMLTYLWQLAYYQVDNKQINCCEQLAEIISKEFLKQFFQQLQNQLDQEDQEQDQESLDDESLFYLQLPRIFDLSSQCHAAILKLFTFNNYLFKKIIKFELKFLINQFRKDLKKKVKKFQKYCSCIMQNHYFYFPDFKQCSLGLSIKLIYMIKQTVVQIAKQIHLSNLQLTQFARQYENMHHLFFQKFIMTKMLSQDEIDKEDNQLFQEGKDFQDFVTNQLNYYFDELVLYAPRYFGDNQIATSSQKLQHFGLFFTLKTQSSEKQLQNKIQLIKNFQKDSGFRVLWQMLSSISLFKCPQKQDLPKACEQTQQMQEQSSYAQQLQFVNMFPILSCFRALIQTALDCQVKSFFFHEYYLIANQIDLEIYKFCQTKAKICKLYAYEVFLNELIPQSFALQGQKASSILLFIQKYFGQNLNELIPSIMKQISNCLLNLNSEQADQVQIAIYALNIIQKMAQRISDRILELQDQNQFYTKQVVKDFNTKLYSLFQTILLLKIDSSAVYSKLYIIAGYFINLNEPKCLYQVYFKLLRQTIACNQQKDCDFIELFLAGMTGILKGIRRDELFRYAAELAVGQVLTFKTQDKLILDNNLLQVYIHFLDSLTKITKFDQSLHCSIRLNIYQIFSQDLQILSKLTKDIPELQKILVYMYIRMAKMNEGFQLIPIPFQIEKKKHFCLLQQYFGSITRLKNINFLNNFAQEDNIWLISYLEAKAQRGQNISIQQLDFEKILNPLRFKKDNWHRRLSLLISMTTQNSVQEILAFFNSYFKKLDDLFDIQHEELVYQ